MRHGEAAGGATPAVWGPWTPTCLDPSPHPKRGSSKPTFWGAPVLCFGVYLIDWPVLRCLLLKWVLGLKTLPTRRTLSDPVLNRLVEDCRAAATVIYLKGCYITMSMERKSQAGRKLMGILCSNVGSADGRVATDFRGTADITTVAESATLVQHEQNVKDKKQTFQPGSLCETAVDGNPVDGGVKLVQGAEGGFEGTVAGQDDDRGRLAASGPASQQQLREEQFVPTRRLAAVQRRESGQGQAYGGPGGLVG